MKEDIKKIIEECLDYDADEDAYDGHEVGSEDYVDNKIEWTERVADEHTKEIITLFKKLVQNRIYALNYPRGYSKLVEARVEELELLLKLLEQ